MPSNLETTIYAAFKHPTNPKNPSTNQPRNPRETISDGTREILHTTITIVTCGNTNISIRDLDIADQAKYLNEQYFEFFIFFWPKFYF